MVNDVDVILAINTGGEPSSDPDLIEAGSGGHGCLLQMTSMKVVDTLRSLLQVRSLALYHCSDNLHALLMHCCMHAFSLACFWMKSRLLNTPVIMNCVFGVSPRPQDSSELFAAYLESFPVAAEDCPLVGLPPAGSDFPSISEAWGATPVLRIALTAKGPEVEMDPTPDELLESMLEMMDDMTNKVQPKPPASAQAPGSGTFMHSDLLALSSWGHQPAK